MMMAKRKTITVELTAEELETVAYGVSLAAGVATDNVADKFKCSSQEAQESAVREWQDTLKLERRFDRLVDEQ